MPVNPQETQQDEEAERPALTVTREEILVDGSDARFRELINNLLVMSKQLQGLRALLAEQFGLSEPQYRLFMTVAQHGADRGVSVGTVAGMLHVTGAFVTAEARKLLQKGLIEKREDSSDRRSVLLSLSAEGQELLARLAERPQAVNDELFRGFTRAEFQFLCDIVRRLVDNGDRAAFLAHALTASDGDFALISGFAGRGTQSTRAPHRASPPARA